MFGACPLRTLDALRLIRLASKARNSGLISTLRRLGVL
jgi:hypothetical protein